MEHTKVSDAFIKSWIVEHWKPLLKYTPLFSSLVNAWFIFHFLLVGDMELIFDCLWLIGKGSTVFT